MKISRILKKIGLYKPAIFAADLAAEQLLKAKYSLYKSRLKRYRSNASKSFGPKVLVIINAGGIGNVVEATPLVQAIRMFWPKSIITILSLPGDLLSDWCIPDETLFSMEQLKGRVFDHTFGPYWYWNQKKELKEVCDPGKLHCVKVLFNKYFLKPEREYGLDLLRKLGYKGTASLYVSMRKPEIEIPASNMRICLAPGGKPEEMWQHKKWPYYDELADMLRENFEDAQILIIGTESDSVPDALLSNPAVIDMRGKLTLAETAWVLKSADLAVGNDCGPIHIADAVQTVSLILFGPTCELKNGPLYKGVSISTPLPCQPCQFSGEIDICKDPQCIRNITPDKVLQKIMSLLAR